MPDARIHRATPLPTGIPGLRALAIASNDAFPRHAHDEYGLGLIETGGHRSWSGIGEVEAGPGMVITVNPGEIHDGRPVAGALRRWRMVYVEPAALARLLGGDARETDLARPALVDRAVGRRLLALFATLRDASAGPAGTEEAAATLLGLAFRRHGAAAPAPERGSPPIARARQRIDDDPAGAASLADLAAACGLSPYQLLRGFLREVGATPEAYRLQARTRRAAALLAAGRPLAEIALEAGFADQSHMTRAFVRQYGVTPGRYRAALA